MNSDDLRVLADCDPSMQTQALAPVALMMKLAAEFASEP